MLFRSRLEPIQSPEGYTAIVDYAHTPDALENVLNAIHEVLEAHYPAEYMAALMTRRFAQITEITKLMEECQSMAVKGIFIK